MNFLGWSACSRRNSRQGRPIAAWVERLERRSLLTLQVSPITAVAGQYFDGAVAIFAAGDVQGTLANFQATIYWTGAVNLTTSGYIAPSGPASYVVYSSNVYAKPGSYPVNVVITGANNSTAQASGTATVSDAPLNTSPVTISPLLQTPFSGAVASFQTTNSYAVSTDFTATINWGDGTTPPTPGAISSNGYNSFSVVGQHTYPAVGTFPITVTVVSPGGQTNVINSTAVVTANPVSVLPTQVTGNAGEPLSGVTVATFLDPYTTDSAAAFRATVDWGDGTINVGTIVSQGDGVYSVSGDHTYQAPGTYAINVQVVRVANGQTASTQQLGPDRQPESHIRLHRGPGLRPQQRSLHCQRVCHHQPADIRRDCRSLRDRATVRPALERRHAIVAGRNGCRLERPMEPGDRPACRRRLRHHGQGHASRRLPRRDDGADPE